MPAARLIALAAPCCLIAPVTLAQWSDDPDINTLVSGAMTGCVITHSAPAPDGGTWIAWFDSSAGYDIVVQKLDAHGTPLLDPPALVVDQSLSWVQDFDLSAAGDGCAVAWADGTVTGVAFVAPDGLVDWQHFLHDGNGYQANAQVCQTNDGFIIAGWIDEAVSKLQRISIDGTFMWDEPVAIAGNGFYSMSDLKPASDHDVIASMVVYTTFSAPKTLKAQRIRADASFVWDAPAIDIFTQGSMQFGNYPEFISDGAGGGIFTWYTTADLQSHVQWIDVDGAKRFGIHGATVAANGSNLHTDPSACHDQATDEVTVFCVRQTSNQAQRGVQANRFDASGMPLWGAGGVELTPLGGGSVPHDLQSVQLNDRACAAWLELSVTGSGIVRTAALDPFGGTAWGATPPIVGAGDVLRGDLSVTRGADMLIAAWWDARGGADRAYAQNINADGTLGDGACHADISGDGMVGVDDLLIVIAHWGQDDSPADVDGDGIVGTDDLLQVLAAWGPCP